MKKVLAFLLVCILFVTPVFAEGMDLSSMSVEELIQLHNQIDEILADKFKCELGVIYPGIYVVGKDIKEGRYLLNCLKTGMVNFWIITLYENEDEFENRNRLYNENLEIGGQAQLNLTDGMVIEIHDGLGMITVAEKQPWEP